jgi:hypothetical protein
VPLALSLTADSVAEPFSDIVTVRPPVVRLLPLASLACIVMVEVLVPSAATPLGLAVRVECAFVATPTGESETSDAIKFTSAVSPTLDGNGNCSLWWF